MEIALARVCVCSATNNSHQLRKEIASALEQSLSAEMLYEALLQTYLFAGFPSAVESLSALANILHERKIDFVPQKQPLNIEEFLQRGEELCRTIYTSAYPKMRSKLGKIAPDLDEWMIAEGYGKTLSRAGLPIQFREICIVAVLAALGWSHQLFSHIRGAYNVGVSSDTIKYVLNALSDIIVPKHFEHALHVLSQVPLPEKPQSEE